MLKYSFFIFLVFFVMACGPKVIYEDTQTLPEPWSYDKGITFQYEIKDTTIAYDLILTIEHLVDFGYENVYVSAQTIFPDKTKISNPVSLQLATEMGTWLGKCDSKKCTTEIVISPQAYFKNLGIYSLMLQQYSRSDSLRGILELGLRIQEAQLN